ncbi:MAG: hypothetical protein LBU53_07520 [Zoogloeaceae bacterium]|jgi:gp16 family phage-associated protein|nr:hypothetical protein [Zoogloeaceae bacterium]
MTTPLHTPLPYPQTRQTARAWFLDNGVCIAEWARDQGLSYQRVKDFFRRQQMPKGVRGEAHRVAVALGLKKNPNLRVDLTAPVSQVSKRSV